MPVNVVEPVAKLQPLWKRAKPILQPLLFLGGVAFDYWTLQMHSWIDQLLLVGYLAAIIVVYGLDMRLTRGRGVPGWIERNRELLDYAGALTLGALLSALAIVVVRAIYPGPTVVFVAILAGMAVANEAEVETLRGDLLRFGLVAFFGFQVGSLIAPFVLGRLVGVGWGIGTAMVAVTAMCLLVELGPSAQRRQVLRDVTASVTAGVVGVLAILVLVALRVVPPLPVVLREAVVARDVERVDGAIRVEGRAKTSIVDRFLNRSAELAWTPGETVAVYTAIYAPPEVELTTRACWDAWHDEGSEWREAQCIEQPVEGGRVDGWRTWTRKANVWDGEWRVRLQLDDGREIGRVRFRLIRSG